MSRLFPDHEVWIKSERTNPGGSIKDRIALAMVEAAEADGSLQPGGTIVEPTSGNTGIGLALVGAIKGYKVILVMPNSMSIERRRLMLAYGATFDLTPRAGGVKAAIERAHEIVASTPGSWMPSQFDNPANVAIHVKTSAREILDDFDDTPIDALITGVGTGGHITGVAEALKPIWPKMKVFAVEPTLSPVISGGAARPARDSGDRRGLHPRQPAYAAARRRHPGLTRGCQGVGAARGARGRHAGRHLERRDAGGDPPKAARPRARRPRPRLQLRYRRALPVGARVPADRVIAGHGGALYGNVNHRERVP